MSCIIFKEKAPKTFERTYFLFPFSAQFKVWCDIAVWLGEWDTATLCLVQDCLNLCGRPNRYHLCLSSLPRQLQAVLTHSSLGVGGYVKSNFIYVLTISWGLCVGELCRWLLLLKSYFYFFFLLFKEPIWGFFA